MATLVVGIVGALAGGLVSMLTSLLTLRSSQRAERARWAADRRWEHASGLVTIKRDAYARYLYQGNALIMAAASTRQKVAEDHKALTQMPPDHAAVYEALEDAWAQSLLLASPSLRVLLEENQNWLGNLMQASWRGETATARDRLYEDLLAAMREEVVEEPQLT
jgi:hypothetical protein